MSSSSYTTSIHPNIPRSIAFPFSIWAIWTARNKFVMENLPFNQREIVKKISSLTIDFFSSSPKGRNVHRVSTSINWNTPPPLSPPFGYFKLNIDGFVKGNLGRASAGGIIRNCMGTGSKAFLRVLVSLTPW